MMLLYMTLLILIAKFGDMFLDESDLAESFKMHSILSYILDLDLFQNLIFYKHYSFVRGSSLSYN
jgi:hypothetical protein